MLNLKDYEVEFRGPTSSDKNNETFTSIQVDLVSSNRILTRENKRLSEYLAAANYNRQVLEGRISSLLSAADTAADSWGTTGNKVLFAEFHSNATEYSTYGNTGFLDVVHGHLRLPTIQSFSKIPLFRDQDGFLQPTSDVTVALSTDGTNYLTKTRPHGVYNALSRGSARFWVEEYDSGSAPADLYYLLRLPKSINPAINCVLVHPFPDNILSIEEISFLGPAGQWTPIPGGDANPATRAMIHFSSRDYADQIRLKLGPSSVLANLALENKQVFGLQSLDVGLLEYQDQAEHVFRLDAGGVITQLKSFDASYLLQTPDAGDYSQFDKDYIWFEIFTDVPVKGSAEGRIYDSRVNEYPLDSNVSVGGSVSTLYVRVGMLRVANTTPTVSALTLEYA